jgi:hypothetical protein
MTKEELVPKIKEIINKWGGVTTGELELSSSPVFNSYGSNHFQLVERFNRNDVTILSYIRETEVDNFNVVYEELNEELLTEIYGIIEEYDTAMIEISNDNS